MTRKWMGVWAGVLCWSLAGGRHTNDLLPLPYTHEARRHVISRIHEIQDAIGRSLLIENVSSYLEFRGAEMTEWDFLAEVSRESGCGILLDVNNIYVSACNHGFDAMDYLHGIPRASVGEIHLAGHVEQTDDEGDPLLIDSHDRPVAAAVWALYDRVIGQCGPIPTLVEWDSDLPEWDTLAAEAVAAQAVLDRHAQRFAQGRAHAVG